MTYQILDNKMGVILTRAAVVYRPPVSRTDLMQIEFKMAPRGAIAVLENNGITYYREIVNGKCEVSLSDMNGVVSVTVALFSDKIPAERWVCEGFIVSHMDSGNVLVMPSDIDLKQEIIDMKLENEQIRADVNRLETMINMLSDRLEHIMEGYNIT